MDKKHLVFSLIFLTALSSIYSYSIEEAIRASIEEFEEIVEERSRVETGNFCFENKNIGSEFSLYIQERISMKLEHSTKFHFIERTHSDLTMNEKPEYLIAGRFFDERISVRLILELIDIESDIVLADTDYSISKSYLPYGIAVRPDDYNNSLHILEELWNSSNPDGQEFEIRSWSRRGEHALYGDGEELTINFFASRPCYIKIYNIDIYKKSHLIFPNKYCRDNYFAGGIVYRIPDGSHSFSFTLGAPFGTESIKVMASTVQFDDIEEALYQGEAASGELIPGKPGLIQTEGITAEAIFGYTVLE